MLMTGGFIQGYVTDPSGAPIVGASVSIQETVGGTLSQSTKSLSDGYFGFTSLPAGTYTVTESLAGYSAAATSASTLVNKTTVNSTSFTVVVNDPSTVAPITVANNGLNITTAAYSLAGTPNINDTTHGTNTGQLDFAVSGANGNITELITLCSDLANDFATGATFTVQPSLTPSDPLAVVGNPAQSTALGELAYLFNHYGSASLSPTDAAGLQLAEWSLEYNGIGGPNIFSILSANTPAAVSASAAKYLADAAAHPGESVYFLNGVTPVSNQGYQGLLGTDLLKFTDTAAPQSSSISGVVFSDCDQNLKQDANNPGIAGVTLTLTGKTTAGVTIAPLTTTTASNGTYSFNNLAPGTYTVTETQPAGYLTEGQVAGSTGGTVATNVVSTTIGSGVSSTGNNFAEVQPGTVSGTVYNDPTGDGIFGEAGQTPFTGGATVQLLDSKGNVVATTTSSTKDGTYSFTNVYPTSYTVKEIAPSGFQQTAPCNTYSVSLTCGQNVTGENFDLLPTYDTSKITCVSFTDYGNCGPATYSTLGGHTSQGDQVSVTFTVTGSSPVTVSFVTYTATSNFDLTKQSVFSVDSGTFAPGVHTLTVTIPESYYQIDFVAGPAIYNFNPSCVNTYHGENRFIQSDNGGSQNAPSAFGSVAGTVYNDKNFNGTFSTGDLGIGGVPVELTGTDSTGHTVKETRITAADGSYTFLGLQPGTYAVSAATPSGYTFETANVGSAGGSTSGSSVVGIKVAGNTNSVSNNFAEVVYKGVTCDQTESDCWWAGSSGQKLINTFGKTASGQTVGQWLVTNYPDLFGGLTSQYKGLTSSTASTSDAAVAQLQNDLYGCYYSGALSEILATALNVFATTSSLNTTSAGQALAAKDGFTVSVAGLGNATYTPSSCDAKALGLSAGGTYTVNELLAAVDQAAASCNSWNWSLFSAADDLFGDLNNGSCGCNSGGNSGGWSGNGSNWNWGGGWGCGW